MISTAARCSLRWLADGRLHLVSGSVSLEVDPRVGARIVSLRCGEAEALSQPNAHPDNYGSTFWDAPQSAWGWPPRTVLDAAPYAAAVERGAAVFRSAVDPVCGLRFCKYFAPLSASPGFAIRYRIENRGDRALRVAPWEVTRVPGGLSFYPAADADGLPASALDLVQGADGFAWYAFDREQLAVGRKHFGAPREGWLAHVTPERLLFVKQFGLLAPALCAEGHAPIEIWGQDGGVYVELENHGASVLLAPGEWLDYTVSWLLCPLPPAMEVRVGNPALPRLVAAMLQAQSRDAALSR